MLFGEEGRNVRNVCLMFEITCHTKLHEEFWQHHTSVEPSHARGTISPAIARIVSQEKVKKSFLMSKKLPRALYFLKIASAY